MLLRATGIRSTSMGQAHRARRTCQLLETAAAPLWVSHPNGTGSARGLQLTTYANADEPRAKQRSFLDAHIVDDLGNDIADGAPRIRATVHDTSRFFEPRPALK